MVYVYVCAHVLILCASLCVLTAFVHYERPGAELGAVHRSQIQQANQSLCDSSSETQFILL